MQLLIHFVKSIFQLNIFLKECCDEFSLLHKDSASHKNQICDEAFIVEEKFTMKIKRC
jgi:hypothetical protein